MKTSKTTCIGPDVHPGMVQLPVAPQINHRIRFAPLQPRKNTHLLPAAAVELVAAIRAADGSADGVCITGPGDPLAEIGPTLDTIALTCDRFPGIRVVLRTLGIGGLRHADKLAKVGANEVELLIDAVEPDILAQLYAWVRPGFKTLQLNEAVSILLHEQSQAVQAFKDASLIVRIDSTCYPTVNDQHLALVARKMAELGADSMVVRPYAPDPNADISLPALTTEDMAACLAQIDGCLPITLGRPDAIDQFQPTDAASILPRPGKKRKNVAVVSSNGMDVDLHLGQAPQILIYGPRDDGLACLLDCRPAPDSGTGKDRWNRLADEIPDCFALLAASAGERPRRILGKHGIQVVITQENIEGTVDILYGGEKKGRGMRPQR